MRVLKREPRARIAAVSVGGAAVAMTLLAGCDWTAFDTFEEDAPAVLLNRSSQVTGGFGSFLTAADIDGEPTLLVGGQPGITGAAAYNIGDEQAPSADASHRGYCSLTSGGLDDCWLANSAAYFPLEDSDGEFDACFAYAWGRVEDGENNGVTVRCMDGSDATLPAPRDARERRDQDFDDDNVHQPQWLASDSAERPLLLVGLPNQNTAWFYAPEETSPNILELPDAEPPDSFGGQVSVLSSSSEGSERLLAVAAPDEGQVWLFRTRGSTAQAVGCLGAYEGFGRTLAAGDVDGDEVDDLVIADEDSVTAFSGAALASLGPAYAANCSLEALPERSVIASFSCGTADDVAGCSGSNFGAALAVGDLDGDGDGEIIVGAPRLSVFGREHAGAALIYDAEGDDAHELSDILYVASAEAGDLLGTSLATIPQGDRDIVAAGGPAHDKVFVFYCTDLLRDRDRTGRCGF